MLMRTTAMAAMIPIAQLPFAPDSEATWCIAAPASAAFSSSVSYPLTMDYHHEMHVVPMEVTFMDMKDNHYKYGTLRSLRYTYSNPFRFLISSLGLPVFFLRIAERER
jgi:hypothetical protein